VLFVENALSMLVFFENLLFLPIDFAIAVRRGPILLVF